jgi:hypothetical protein
MFKKSFAIEHEKFKPKDLNKRAKPYITLMQLEAIRGYPIGSN